MRELVLDIDPILTTECEVFDFSNPPFNPIDFAKQMAKVMRDADGIGLAANQIGVSYRIIVIRKDPNLVMFNPRIVEFSEKEVLLEEGCLSFPGLFCKLKRPKDIKVRYTLPNGETKTEEFTGVTSRVIQHEIDHLNGILYFNRANRYHREKALKDRKKFMRKLPPYKLPKIVTSQVEKSSEEFVIIPGAS